MKIFSKYADFVCPKSEVKHYIVSERPQNRGEAMEKEKFNKILNEVFRNLMLCFNGIFLTNKIDNSMVWLITKTVEEVYFDAYRKVEKLDVTSLKERKDETDLTRTHPAIMKLLKILDASNKK